MMKRLYRRRGVWKYVGGLALCAACVLFLSAGLKGQAARTGTVAVESARVRQEASTNAGIAGSLSSGDTVTIVDETESGGSTWYQVSYTQDGEEVTGWLRSDLLSVSETEEPETTEEPAETEEPEAPAAAYTIQEPSEAPSADYLIQTSVLVGDASYTAWQADAETALYLVWASASDGSSGWYWYDPAQGTFQQDLGQFSSQGLVAALQRELTTLKDSSADSLSMRLYIIIGLGVLCVILLVLVIVFAVRSRGMGYEYEDDEDYDEDDSADEDEFDSGDDEDGFEKEKGKKKGFFSRRRAAEEDEERDDFDDFMDAVKKKRSGDTDEEEESLQFEEEEKADLTLTANLPQIDMTAVEEVEKEAEAEKAAEETEKAQKKTEDGDDEDFDIEILDFDDLDL